VKHFPRDATVLSELIKPGPDRRVVDWIETTDEDMLFLSVLTLGEIRKGIGALRPGARQARLEAWLESGLRPRFAGRILPIDESVAGRWGAISSSAAAAGKPVPVIDGLLAATALDHNLTLVTRNTADVMRAGVAVFSPWE
jgi:predicted nucleic acid-binding protein